MQAVIQGATFEVQPEPADFWTWVKEGRYDKEWDLIKSHLRPEHTFIDLGAWVGSHSLLASTIAKRVVAVEPDPVAMAILKQNLAGQRIAVWHGAVTGYDGIVKLGSGLLGASTTRVNPNPGAGIGAWESGQDFDIQCLTLRSLIAACHAQDPLFIKMDVEGSEEDILQDVDFFKEHKPFVYLEEHPWWWKDVESTRSLIEEISRHATVMG